MAITYANNLISMDGATGGTDTASGLFKVVAATLVNGAAGSIAMGILLDGVPYAFVLVTAANTAFVSFGTQPWVKDIKYVEGTSVANLAAGTYAASASASCTVLLA